MQQFIAHDKEEAEQTLQAFEDRAKTEEQKAGYRMMRKLVPVLREVFEDLANRNLPPDQLDVAASNSIEAIGSSLAAVIGNQVMQIPPQCEHNPPCVWLMEASRVSNLLAEGSAKYFAECFKAITETVGHA